MRLLLLGPTAGSGGLQGGIETQIRLLSQHWQRMGHPVQTIDTFHRPWTAASALHLLRVCRSNDVVVLMGVTLKGWSMAWPAGRPLLFSHHTHLSGGRFPLALKRWLLRRQANVFNSGFLRTALGASPQHGPVIHPCYDDAAFPEKSSPGAARRWHIGFLGRLVPDKGVEVLLEALARCEAASACSVLILGEGPCRAELERRASSLPCRTRFQGSLSPPEVPAALASIRCLVVPSLWQEPFGIVVLEALAAGCRVIASKVGGVPEAGGDLIRYVPPGDPLSLARALGAELAEAPRPQLCERRRKHLSRFRAATVAERYLTVIGGLLP